MARANPIDRLITSLLSHQHNLSVDLASLHCSPARTKLRARRSRSRFEVSWHVGGFAVLVASRRTIRLSITAMPQSDRNYTLRILNGFGYPYPSRKFINGASNQMGSSGNGILVARTIDLAASNIASPYRMT